MMASTFPTWDPGSPQMLQAGKPGDGGVGGVGETMGAGAGVTPPGEHPHTGVAKPGTKSQN